MTFSNCILRRIFKEVEKFNKNESINKKYYLFMEDNFLICTNYKSELFRLNIPSNYPFFPYKVNFFNGSNNYFRYLYSIFSNIKKNNYDKKIISFFYNIQFKKISLFLKSDNECFCCSSILCSNNWSPNLTIINFIDEYEEIKFIELFIKYYKKYENIYINIFNKLSNDIIDQILFLTKI